MIPKMHMGTVIEYGGKYWTVSGHGGSSNMRTHELTHIDFSFRPATDAEIALAMWDLNE